MKITIVIKTDERKWGWSVDDVMPRRDGLRIMKILKKIKLSSDHGVVKLGFDHDVEKFGSDHGVEKLKSDHGVEKLRLDHASRHLSFCHWGRECSSLPQS